MTSFAKETFSNFPFWTAADEKLSKTSNKKKKDVQISDIAEQIGCLGWQQAIEGMVHHLQHLKHMCAPPSSVQMCKNASTQTESKFVSLIDHQSKYGSEKKEKVIL